MYLAYIGIPIILLFFWGIRIVRPTHRGLIERFGKYKTDFANLKESKELKFVPDNNPNTSNENGCGPN